MPGWNEWIDASEQHADHNADMRWEAARIVEAGPFDYGPDNLFDLPASGDPNPPF